MELDRMLKALGEPMRLKIYQSLLERKHCVRSLSKKFSISESAISSTTGCCRLPYRAV